MKDEKLGKYRVREHSAVWYGMEIAEVIRDLAIATVFVGGLWCTVVLIASLG